MKALVLAAGMSTRIESLADGLPKPLIKIGEETVLERSLKWLAAHDITDIRINLHYKPEAIKEVIGDGSSTGTTVQYSMENDILGTAGAVKKLEGEWDSDFLVVYGDNILGFNLKNMISQHQDAITTIAVYNWDQDQHSGIAGGRVLLDEGNNIVSFTEGGNDISSPWVNAGAYVLSPEICAHIPENEFSDFGKDIFPKLLAENLTLKGFPINSYCLAADTPDALQKARQVISKQ